ncbi:ABC transporter substrate-binding protein [Actinomycetaceae bacterium L2_0104]
MSRLRTSLAALSAVSLLVLAGCSGQEEPEPESTTSAAAQAESTTIGDLTITPAEDGTLTIDGTVNGTVTGVPAEPQRVVALWRVGSELAELEVTPVAALEGEFLESELGPEFFASVSDIPTVGSFEGVDIEEVIAADPDLIIGMDNGGLSIDYEPLQEIAPTVILPIAEPTDVWRNYPAVAAVLGKSSDYDERLADLDAKLEAIAEEYGEDLADKPVTVVNSSMDKIWASTSKSLVYERLVQAGFTYNPSFTDNPDRYVQEITAENLADLSDQSAILYQTDLEGAPLPGTDELRAMDSYKRLPAVEAGLEFPLTSGVIYTFEAADKQVEDIRAAAEALAAAN